MRINKYVALSTGMSRRKADDYIATGKVSLNSVVAKAGDSVTDGDTVTLNGKTIKPQASTTIVLNKPVGFVCSRDGQGSQTVYDLLPGDLHNLKPVGRLDKDSSGLLLLTNDGELAQKLTHPSFAKQKVYQVKLDKDLSEQDFSTITKTGVTLDDGISTFKLDYINDNNVEWTVTMSEGRNRQIRRTFEALSYHVRSLHRTSFGEFSLGDLASGKWTVAPQAKPTSKN